LSIKSKNSGRTAARVTDAHVVKKRQLYLFYFELKSGPLRMLRVVRIKSRFIDKV